MASRTNLPALDELFDEHMALYEKVRGQGADDSSTEIKAVLEKMSVDLEYLLAARKGTTVEMDSFRETAKLFRGKMKDYKKELVSLKLETGRKEMLREINAQAEAFRGKCKDLLQSWKGKSVVDSSTKLAGELETRYSSTVTKIQEAKDELQLVKLKSQFDSAMNEASAGLKDCLKTIEHKQVIFKRVDECYEKMDVQYRLFAQSLPLDMHDTGFLDGDILQEKVTELLHKAKTGFEVFELALTVLKDKVEQSEDNAGDASLLSEAIDLAGAFSHKLQELKHELTLLKDQFAMTPEGKLAREVRVTAEFIEQMHEMDIYKLPVALSHKNERNGFRHFTLGTVPTYPKPAKVIMMVGMTGAGKSLMINNIVNYVYGVKYEDNFRFKLILEHEELDERSDVSMSKAESMTRWVSSYTLFYQEGSRVPFTLILIDTPGFGDTRGITYDEKIVKSLKKFFADDVYPIRELSNIGLVVQASQARLTGEQFYVFNAVLNIFGNDVVKNICIMFTFADAQDPPALEAVKANDIPYPENGVFKFNNSAVFAGRNDESNAYYWKFGFQSLEKFFVHIGTVKATSLTLTNQVLSERETLHLLLDGLQKKISDGFETLQSLENTTRVIIELQGAMNANKNFKVKKIIYPQETKVVDHFITNCKVCMFTCHDPCHIAGDIKTGCSAMHKCVKCPGECPPESHSNGDRIYIYTKVETEETIEVMMKRYNIAMNDKKAQTKIIHKLLNEYKDHKNKVFDDIQQACKAAERLEQIALGKSMITSVDYIDRLILSERMSNRPNKENRVKQLEHFKEKAEMLSNARNNPELLTGKMSRYEEVVMNAIKKLEEQSDNSKKGVNKQSKIAAIKQMLSSLF